MPTFTFSPVEGDPFADPAARAAYAPPSPAGSLTSDLGLGLQHDVSRLVGGFGNALTTVGNSLMGNTHVGVSPSGAVTPIDPSLVDSANVLAGAVMEGGLAAPRPGESLGVFGGINALTANKGALANAQMMERMGASPDHIWTSTGWGRGADGQWRFEIPDTGSELWEGNQIGQSSTALANVLSHDKLFAAYPDLERVYVTPWMERQGGMYSPYDDTIQVQNYDYGGNDPHTILMHEVQHAIQSREGFAQGGSPDDPAIRQLGSGIVSNVQDQIDALKAKPVLGEDDAAKLFHLIKIKNALITRSEGEIGYQTLAGEVESRNVETRKGWNVDTTVPPWQTEDVPRYMQNVRILKDWLR